MKICANISSNELNSFLGKEVWVKCRYGTSEIYARFLSATSDHSGETWYQCNALPCSLLEPGISHPERQHRLTALRLASVSRLMEFQSSRLALVEPEDVIATDALFGMMGIAGTYAVAYQHNYPILKRIAGKPYWIYVRYHGEFMYIHVHDLAGDVVTLSAVDDDYIVDYVYRWNDKEPWEVYENGEEFTAHVAEFVIFDPVEIFTTDEFEDLILQSQELWESGRAAEEIAVDHDGFDWEGE